MKPKELPPKQQRFCEEYLIDLNASAAYVRAGYKESSTTRTCAAQLLTKPHIQATIEKLQAGRSARTRVTADFVLGELAKVAGFDPRKLFENDGSVKSVRDWDDDTAAAIQSFDVAEIFTGTGDEKHAVGLSKKVSTRDKVRALELLGKHLGLFPNKVTADVGESLAQLILGSMKRD